MAEERDSKVSQRYRELGGEEPSREVDAAILAAARHGTDKPHAPLVASAGRHRWYYSLGAAAILVLAIAVTLHVDREQPDPELAAAPAPSAQQAKPEAAPQSAPPALERERSARQERPMADSTAAARMAAETPERELERIAELRRQGRDDEADKALAEFRRRYPAYRVPDAMLGKVDKK